jgi:PhnB protein
MVVSDAVAAVEFLRSAFGATGHPLANRPAEMRIGDSVVMVSEASEREVFPAFLYIYVDDAQGVYRQALAAGAVSVEEPWDTPYGDRRRWSVMCSATSTRSPLGTIQPHLERSMLPTAPWPATGRRSWLARPAMVHRLAQ